MSKFRKALVNNKGFTLIELLVVIAVLGILAAIAIPRLGGVTEKAKVSEGETILGTVNNAASMYYTENNSWPSSKDDIAQYVDNIDNLLPDNDSGDGWQLSSNGFDTDNNTVEITHPDITDYDLLLTFDSGAITTN